MKQLYKDLCIITNSTENMQIWINEANERQGFSQMGVQAHFGQPLFKEYCFIFHMLLHKLSIWTGPIVQFGHPLFDTWLKAWSETLHEEGFCKNSFSSPETMIFLESTKTWNLWLELILQISKNLLSHQSLQSFWSALRNTNSFTLLDLFHLHTSKSWATSSDLTVFNQHASAHIRLAENKYFLQAYSIKSPSQLLLGSSRNVSVGRQP